MAETPSYGGLNEFGALLNDGDWHEEYQQSQSSAEAETPARSMFSTSRVMGLVGAAALFAGAGVFAAVGGTKNLVDVANPGASTEDLWSTSETESDWRLKEYTTTITMDDFLKDDKVLKWLNSKGLSEDSDHYDLMPYVPTEIVIEGNPTLLQGNIGPGVMDGYTAFSMQMKNQSGLYSASYNIVIDMRGHLVSISPVMHHLGHDYHMISFKPYSHDPDYFLGSVDVEATQSGPSYLWKWTRYPEDKPEYVKLMDGTETDCHDVSNAYEGDFLWATCDDKGICKYNAADGDKKETHKYDVVYGPNHAQMLEKDSIAIISSRITNAIVKVNVTSDEVLWVAGGPNGTMDLIDEDGKHFEAGKMDLWKGQHNVEYLGNDEYAMFDDESNVNWSGDEETQEAQYSRLLIVKINEAESTATVKWSYGVGAYTPIYGDNDKMPTGNMLGTMWVGDMACKDWEKQCKHSCDCSYYPYDAEIMEVDRVTKETALSVRIRSNTTWKEATTWAGWSIYSAERIYKEPLLYRVSCEKGKVTDTTRFLTFYTHNSFKQYNKAPGKYRIKDADENTVSEGYFDFNPYWDLKKMEVTADLDSCNGRVEVENQWGQWSGHEFNDGDTN
eukprot:CAMPEP_0119512872 /NCGR_PEP_ID=MMETSP1344-20130328/31132_1 /TAXON_ID=236787 /ORGANISM="Florenciella parvula, Strain CCMP2471" /LENGTH=613 /DNA_ID=CAMNT_0007550041 /DNA_START=12 /DNA_END=1853 /DNA_ORIENTATION=+